jgi:acyl carrier protein
VATSGEIAAEPEAALPPIGAPVSNAQVYVLDRHQQPVAAGKIGEMYIGGTGVARGYRNRADLTAEHFLENPFSPSSSARMYRTGDLGRVLPDGRVSFCGRSDDQEEIRGHRIKAHEIVRVLDRHPGVVSSAIATHGEGWHKRLVAYVVPASGAHLTSGVLGDFLRRQLPDYMVPSAFVSLAELPLTSSGKLDHAALPDASKENCLAGSGFRGPTNPVERQVTSMLRDVLHLEPVGLDDHFCPVDGDSSSAQLIRRVRERFSVELSPHDLTEAQTVMKLAAEIERRMLTQLDSLTEEEAGRLLSLDAASARP